MVNKFFNYILQINLLAVLLAKLQAVMGFQFFSNLDANAESALRSMEKPFHPCVIADWMPFSCVYTTVPIARRFSMERSTNPKWVSRRESCPSSQELLALQSELIEGKDPREPDFSERLLLFFPRGTTLDKALCVLFKWTYLWCTVNLLHSHDALGCFCLTRCRHFWNAMEKLFEEEIRTGIEESNNPKENANLWFHASRISFEISLKPDFNPFIEQWSKLRKKKNFEILMLEAILQTRPSGNSIDKDGNVRCKPIYVPENLNSVAARYALAKKFKFGSENLNSIFAKNRKEIKTRIRARKKSDPLPVLKNCAPETIFVSECTNLYEWIGYVLDTKNPSVTLLVLMHIMSGLPLWNIVFNDAVSKDGSVVPRFRVMQGRQVVTVKVSTFIRWIRILARRGHFVGLPSLQKNKENNSQDASQQPTSIMLYWDDRAEEEYLKKIKVMENFSENEVKDQVSRYFRALEASGCVHPNITHNKEISK